MTSRYSRIWHRRADGQRTDPATSGMPIEAEELRQLTPGMDAVARAEGQAAALLALQAKASIVQAGHLDRIATALEQMEACGRMDAEP
jgi:hypothetical protein